MDKNKKWLTYKHLFVFVLILLMVCIYAVFFNYIKRVSVSLVTPQEQYEKFQWKELNCIMEYWTPLTLIPVALLNNWQLLVKSIDAQTKHTYEIFKVDNLNMCSTTKPAKVASWHEDIANDFF